MIYILTPKKHDTNDHFVSKKNVHSEVLHASEYVWVYTSTSN